MSGQVLDDIIAAVRVLCEKHENPQTITCEKTGKPRRVTLTADGLISGIRAAVHGGIGSHENSTPLDQKCLIDAGALELYTDIEKHISRLHHGLTGKPDYLYPEATLTAWCARFADDIHAGAISEPAQLRVRDVLEEWVARIRGYFDPPRVLEITTSCPVCGERYAFNPSTGDQIPAVVVQFRDTLGSAMLDEAIGICRFCETRWKGRQALRELRYEIDTAAQPV